VVSVCALLVMLGSAAPVSAATEAIQISDVSAINSGDTAWMLTSTALVLLMTGPGLALFYCGLVRRKNVLATMMQSFVLMAAVSVVWAIVGYSLAFDAGNPFIGGLRFAFLNGVGAAPCEYAPTIPHTVWMAYQLMFAIITPALICGAYAERMKFSSVLMFSIGWLLVVYCPMAHMVWGKGGFLNSFSSGTIPMLDFAGGAVVHISSGVSALVCALMLGKRRGYGRTSMQPHSVVLSVIGAALLWVGWFGFNAGSALSAGGLAGVALVNTHLAGATAAMAWLFLEWYRTGKPTALGAISGAVAGLAIITPASGFTTPMFAMVIGVLGGVLCFFGATSIKHRFGYDDSLDAFGIHGVSGVAGTFLTGVFAVGAIHDRAGLVDGNPMQMAYQAGGILVTVALSVAASFVLLKITSSVCGLRVSDEHEFNGLDLSLHGETGYNLEDDVFSSSEDEEMIPAPAEVPVEHTRPALQPA